MITKLPEKI